MRYRFPLIEKLPPYVFAVINHLKMEARHRGEDIIDLGMGNLDLATPDLIVDKLVEAARNPRNHRYSASRGIPNLRVEISRWYARRLAYADLTFDGYKAPSILQVKGAKDVAVEMFSMSKSYSMAGWRVGFCVGNSQAVAALMEAAGGAKA